MYLCVKLILKHTKSVQITYRTKRNINPVFIVQSNKSIKQIVGLGDNKREFVKSYFHLACFGLEEVVIFGAVGEGVAFWGEC